MNYLWVCSWWFRNRRDGFLSVYREDGRFWCYPCRRSGKARAETFTHTPKIVVRLSFISHRTVIQVRYRFGLSQVTTECRPESIPVVTAPPVPSMEAAAKPDVGAVFAEMFRHPAHYFVAQWNWKSALTSALIRGAMFFATNITAGFQAASWALLLQFAYRAATSGFWGSFTQAMRHAEPRWLAGLVVGVGLSVFAHLLEFLIHWAGGTAELKRSILVSIGFTVISNLFNLYIMQRNALVVGKGSQSFGQDMAQMPRLIAGFLAWPFLLTFRALRPSPMKTEPRP